MKNETNSKIVRNHSLVNTFRNCERFYCFQSDKLGILPTYAGGLAPAQLERVVDYIDTYLNCELSLCELAQLVQLSPHYFSQLFKQSTEFSPHQYILRRRIDRGKQLLLKGGVSIAGVAKMVGFVDQSHFHRHFKRLEGITPKAFVSQVR